MNRNNNNNKKEIYDLIALLGLSSSSLGSSKSVPVAL